MFETIGEKSRRQIVVDLVETVDYGGIIEYDTLADALSVEDKGVIQAAVHAAKPAIERAHAKAVEAIPNVGYRVVLPSEHGLLATKQQRKSRRAIVRAKSKIDNVDLNKLSDTEKAVIAIYGAVLASQIEFSRRADLRYARKETLDQLITQQSKVNTRTDAELQEMRARLADLENRIDKAAS